MKQICFRLMCLPRYHTENSNVAFGSFRFGPLFLRLCYELGLDDMAAETITDKVIHHTRQLRTDVLNKKY